MTDLIKVIAWFCSHDTGISSKAIASHMTVGKAPYGSYPSDPADLGRCLRLLDKFPDWSERMPDEMAAYGPEWKAMASNWPKLAEMMAEEVGIAWEKGRAAPKTYDFMRTLRKIERAA